MLLTFTHPIIADARTRRSETIRQAVGTVETPIEIAEYGPSDVEPAFDIPGTLPIVSLGDKLWRKSPLDVKLLSRSFEHLSNVPDGEIAMIDTDFQAALMDLGAGNGNLVIPKPPARLLSTYLGNKDAMEFLAKAGPISQRNLAYLNEADLELWRIRMRSFLDNYALVGDVTYQRCHEPLMIVDRGRITLQDASIYKPYINRIAFTADGWIQFPDGSLRSDVHAFPADAEDEVMRFSEKVNGGEANAAWFSINCHGRCMSLGTVIEQETCRFTMMHARYFSEVDRKFRTRFGEAARTRELDREGSDFGTYARAVVRAAEVVTRHQAEASCYEDVAEAFDELVAVASDADKLFETQGDRYVWDRLCTNTELMRSRMDDLPISLAVTRNHGPKS